jgi:hypothetical protein
VSSWSIANPWSQRSTCSRVLMGQIMAGDVVCVVGPAPPFVTVPPVPPPTEAQAAAKPTADANPNILTNDFMISPFAATSAVY